MSYDQLHVYLGPAKERTKEEIQQAAKSRKMSVSAFIMYCIQYVMDRDKTGHKELAKR